MSVFKDLTGQEWEICFDAFVLADIAKETGVDLSDVSAGGWSKLAIDAGLVGRVLAILCREDAESRKIFSPRAFTRLIRGEAIDRARAALVAEGADFFPKSDWSAIQSSLKRRKTAKEQAETLQTAMSALEGMGPDFRAGAMKALMEMGRTAAMEGINSSHSKTSVSVVGPDVTPSSVVTSGPVKSESPPTD